MDDEHDGHEDDDMFMVMTMVEGDVNTFKYISHNDDFHITLVVQLVELIIRHVNVRLFTDYRLN